MRRFLWPVCAIVALALGFAWGAATVKYRLWPYWLARPLFQYENASAQIREAYYAQASGKADLVLVGDSILRLIEVNEAFPDLDGRNRSIDGQTSADILARIEPLAAMNSETYVIMVGTNDALRSISPGQTADTVTRIVAALPGRKLLLQVPPCNPARSGCDQGAIDAINQRIAGAPGAEFVTYELDPATQLHDVVHPTPEGLAVLAGAVRHRLR